MRKGTKVEVFNKQGVRYCGFIREFTQSGYFIEPEDNLGIKVYENKEDVKSLKTED